MYFTGIPEYLLGRSGATIGLSASFSTSYPFDILSEHFPKLFSHRDGLGPLEKKSKIGAHIDLNEEMIFRP
jgi:hypothetical protein